MFAYTNLSMKTFLPIKIILLLFLLFSLTGCEKTPAEEELPFWFYNPFGYASLSVSGRDGVEAVRVSDEVEFLEALLDEDVRAIEIASDLSLGSKELEEKLKAKGKSLNDFRSVYRVSRAPQVHPVLKETGVGRIRIRLREGLLLFSRAGHSLKHAGFEIDEAKDIVIRNLVLEELWEWDDAGAGSYKENDWDYFVIEKSEGIWLDHLTFRQAYDGIVDVKEGCRNMTLSFSRLDFRPNAFIQAQIDYLEENRESYPYYDSLRDDGLTPDDILKMASYQKKGFNLGNQTDGEGYESITFTFHHLLIWNLQDRMPRIRKGDAHVYQITLDNTDIWNLNLAVNSKGVNLVNQGIVTTEGGAVFMENSLFINVQTPVKTHQESSSDQKFTGKFKVLESAYRRGEREYFGSSEGKAPVWTPANPHPLVPFALRNHEEIPYKYELMDIAFLPEFFEKYPPGAQNLEKINWTIIDSKLHEKGD